MPPHFTNLYETVLTVDVNISATSITVADVSDMPKFPFTAILAAESANLDECVLVTANPSGSTLTVVRGYELVSGNGASAHAAGARFAAVLTKGGLAKLSTGTKLYNYTNLV